MIPLTVIGGYLGSGKTTLLNHLLRSAAGRRLALIVNDFGELNIDAELIESRTDEQINLTNGCICCGMSDGFDAALDGIVSLESPPDHILVEASGVADVALLGRYGFLPGLCPDGVIVLADSTSVHKQAQDRFIGTTILRQLRGADLIILSKSDRISQEAIAELRVWIEQESPGIPMLESDQNGLPLDVVLGAQVQNPQRTANGSGSEHPEHPAPHAEYVSWSMESDVSSTRTQLERFIAALPDSAIRVKGSLDIEGERTILQRTGARTETTSADGVATGTRLVAIGLRGVFDPAAMDAAARCLQRD